MSILKVTHIPTSTSRPEKHIRNPQLLCHIEGESHATIGNDAGHRRRVQGRVELPENLPEVREAVLPGGLAQRGCVLRGSRVRRREPIGDGLEAKGREAVEGVGASGFEEALVVVLGVDEGNVEALVVEELG